MKTLLYSLCAILIFQASFGLLASCGMEQSSTESMSEIHHMMTDQSSAVSDHDCCDPETDSMDNSTDATNCECAPAVFSLALDVSNKQAALVTSNQYYKDKQLPWVQCPVFELLRPPISI